MSEGLQNWIMALSVAAPIVGFIAWLSYAFLLKWGKQEWIYNSSVPGEPPPARVATQVMVASLVVLSALPSIIYILTYYL